MFDLDSLLLNRPLSPTSDTDPDDVLAAKTAFKQLGYYEIPSYGLTPYPDETLFDGIRSYQKDKGLAVDGYMLPAGETEQSVNKSLAGTAQDGKDEGCVDPALFPWSWPWDNRRRRDNCPLPREKSGRPECERQALADEEFCRSITGPNGPYRRQRCWASVQPRYGYCEKTGQLGYPPLDTGE